MMTNIEAKTRRY